MSIIRWMDKQMWYIHTMDDYSAIKRSKLLLHAIILTNFNIIMLSERLQRLYTASVQFSSLAQSCLTLCDPMIRSTPGLPVHHQLLEFTQTHVQRVGDAIQPSHPPLSPSPPAPNPSRHQGLCQWVNSSHEVAKGLEFQPQHQSFQWTPGLVSFRIDWLDLLAVQGILKILQHHNSEVSIIGHSVFFKVQFTWPYKTNEP